MGMQTGAVWNFLKKLKMELPFDPVIPLLGIYPKNPKTATQKDICTPMFIAALFIIAKIWKQLKRPSVDSGSKKLEHLHNGILCSSRKEGILTFCNSMVGIGEHYAK